MEKVHEKELSITQKIDDGSFAEIWECDFEGKKYAYKKFESPEKFIDKSFVAKMDAINELCITKSAIPSILVSDDHKNLGYLSELLTGRECVDIRKTSQIIEALKSAKDAILEIHSAGIIHTDIHGSNIFVTKSGSILIDYDNCAYKENKPIVANYSDFAHVFVARYGLSKNLDIYLFNLLTFSLINDYDILRCPHYISSNDYGVFQDEEVKKICRALLLENHHFNNQYLIDTVQPEDFEKTLIYK